MSLDYNKLARELDRPHPLAPDDPPAAAKTPPDAPLAVESWPLKLLTMLATATLTVAGSWLASVPFVFAFHLVLVIQIGGGL